MEKSLLWRSARAALVVVLLTGIPMVSGCAWKPEIKYVDPALTSKDLVTGAVAVLPVKFENERITPQERLRVTASLVRAIQLQREDIPMHANAAMRAAYQGALAEEAALLKVYDEAQASPKMLAELGQSAQARYLILSRLNYEQTVTGGRSSMANNTVQSILSGTVSLVDSTSARVVWEGSFSLTKSGVDDNVDPKPSIHAPSFFPTFVKAWPAEQ